MISKAELLNISQLNQKKYRKKYRKFLIEGKRLIDECLKSGFVMIEIFYTNQFSQAHEEFLTSTLSKKIHTRNITEIEMTKICDTQNPQGICAVVEMPIEKQALNDYDNLIVALENISDPGNLGTILRNCGWFGIKNVIIDKNCADIYNPKVTRASMGAIFHLNIYEPDNFYDYLKEIKKSDCQICCADMNGENLYKVDKKLKRVIVFSNEANGPTENLESISNSKITIPRIGEVESLNVASASAIILAELTR